MNTILNVKKDLYFLFLFLISKQKEIQVEERTFFSMKKFFFPQIYNEYKFIYTNIALAGEKMLTRQNNRSNTKKMLRGLTMERSAHFFNQKYAKILNLILN
jgi:hypothetical protein